MYAARFALVLLALPTVVVAGSIDTPTKPTSAPAKPAVTATAPAAVAGATPYVRTGRAEKSFDGWYYVEVPIGLPAKSLTKLVPAVQGAAKSRGLMAYPIKNGVQVWAVEKEQTIIYSTSLGGDTVDCKIGFGAKSADPAGLDAIEAKLVALHESLFADAKARSEAAKSFE